MSSIWLSGAGTTEAENTAMPAANDDGDILTAAEPVPIDLPAVPLKRDSDVDIDETTVSAYMETDYPWSAAASPMSSWHAANG